MKTKVISYAYGICEMLGVIFLALYLKFCAIRT